MITAPYNFVPLSKKVVAPYWGPLVSHDRPFEQGLSGVLDLEIEAISPIYVRNGEKREENQDPDTSFNNLNGKYYIPGTSIKGMLRSMVEIMSFGSMVDKVEDVKYSVRDFSNGAKDIYNPSTLSQNIRGGYLYKEGNNYFLIDAGKPGRISHEELAKKYNNGNSIFDYYRRQQEKSIKHKNEKYPELIGPKFSFIHEKTDFGRELYLFDDQSNVGQIVLTGQPGTNQGRGKKKFEFVFFDNTTIISKPIPLDKKTIENFLFAYYDHEPKPGEDWVWRKKQLHSGEKIPVFFRKKGDAVLDLGLTFLYKITYKNSVGDSINKTQGNAQKIDLADAIFGYSEKESSLKGRVNISHGFVSGNPKVLPVISEILSSPKASYFPNYVRQNEKEGEVTQYQTFNNDNVEISGWKRYPIKEGLSTNQGDGNQLIKTSFKPLDKGTKFTCQINYHNLKAEELGALLSAITFHDNEGHFHSIGMAKPLGYGVIKVKISNLNSIAFRESLKHFEMFMNTALQPGEKWNESVQVQELFAMAKHFPGTEKLLKYMQLSEFSGKKGRAQADIKYALQKYSAITGESIQVNSLITDSELTDYKIRYNEEKSRFDKLASTDKSQFWFEMHLAQAKKSSEELQLARKTALLEMLKIKEEQILEEKKDLKNRILEETRIQRQKADDEAKKQRDLDKINGGFEVSDIKSNAKGFDEMTRKVTIYAEAYHGKKLVLLKEEKIAYLPFEDHRLVSEKIIEMYANFNKKDKSKWEQKPIESNIIYQKLINWMGLEAAIAVFDKLNLNQSNGG